MNRSERSSAQTEPFVFRGFDSPNTTQVPDAFFDEVAPQLTEAELRVALYIIRRTFGFKKDADTISLRQMVQGITTRDGRVLDRGTGLKKSAVANALNGLERKGVILSQRNRSVEKGNEPTTYALNIRNSPLSVPVDKGLSIPADKPLSVPVDTQYTERQQTVEQHTENQYSNRFDILTQNSKNSATFEKSKKRDFSDQNSLIDAVGASTARGGFRSVQQVLAARPDALPSSRRSADASQRPKNAPGSAVSVSSGSSDQFSHETPQKRQRGRPRRYPVPPDLELFTRDISVEFHDASKAPSNLSFIGRVLHETGLPASVLYQLMQEARQLTKSRGNIEKPSADDPGFRNRFPYFRKTLLDLVEKEGRVVAARRHPLGTQGSEAS